jgi:hypothetical protein
VEGGEAGGGAAAAAQRRPGALHCAGGRGAEQSSTYPRKKKRGERSEGPMCKTKRFQGPLGKAKFLTNLKV